MKVFLEVFSKFTNNFPGINVSSDIEDMDKIEGGDYSRRSKIKKLLQSYNIVICPCSYCNESDMGVENLIDNKRMMLELRRGKAKMNNKVLSLLEVSRQIYSDVLNNYVVNYSSLQT